MNLRCGCITHRDSDDLVGCPVIQVERLTSLIGDLEKQIETQTSIVREVLDVLALYFGEED